MKRILLVTYYFPPCGGAAVQRWHRLIRELIRQGCSLTVICPEEGIYPNIDTTLLNELPPELRVMRTGKSRIHKLWSRLSPQAMPYGDLKPDKGSGAWHKFLIWFRLNFIIPDLRLFWVQHAFRAIQQELMINSYDALITTGPPHSTHLAGYIAKLLYNVRWISDFRDPWTQIHYLQLNPPGKLSMALHRYLERKVVQSSDLVLVISEYISSTLPPGNKYTLYNSFDATQFPEDIAQEGVDTTTIGSIPTKSDQGMTLKQTLFKIKYIGQLTAGQYIGTLLKVLNTLDASLSVQFVGTRIESELLASLKELQNLHIDLTGFVEHKEALKQMLDSQILVLLINDYPGSEGMLTTKLFEYLASRRPILCLGNTEGEAARLIKLYDAGECFDYNDLAGIKDYVLRLYRNWEAGLEHCNSSDLSAIQTSTQVRELLKLI